MKTIKKSAKIKVCVITNPFDLSKQERFELNVRNCPTVGKVLTKHVQKYNYYGTDVEFDCVVGNDIVDADYRFLDNDVVVYVPRVAGGGGGNSNVFAFVASIALMVIGNVVGGWLAGALNLTGNAAKLVASIGAAVFMSVGSMILAPLFQQPMDSGLSDYSTAQTYAWSPHQASRGQGAVIPLCYGTNRTAGNILSTHVTTDGTNQYLNMLIALCEGPIDSIENIKINGNSLASYENVEIYKRFGTNDQLPIDNFCNTYEDKNAGFELIDGEWRYLALDSNSISGLEVLFSLPRGLCHFNDRGEPESSTVNYAIEYALVGASTWTAGASGQITDSTTSAIFRNIEIKDLAVGQYQVRVQVSSRAGAGNRYSNDCFFAMLTGVIKQGFSMPGTALLGIRALATNQLSGGIPSVTADVTRSTVHIYNPYTSTWITGDATNPACVAYDLVVGAKKYGNDYVCQFADYNTINYDSFAHAISVCDDVNDKRTFNMMFDTERELKDLLLDVENLMHGKVIQRGQTFDIIMDEATSPCFIFNESNIVKDSFTEEWLPVTDRANSCEITFTNKDKNYQRDVIVAYDDDYNDTTTIKKPANVTLNGCNNLAQAYKEAVYRLRNTKYLLRTASWKTGVDALSVQTGDVVAVQSDVTNWGEGGRLIAVGADNYTLTLDKPFTMVEGKEYQLWGKHSDDTVGVVDIVTIAGTSANVICATSFAGKIPKVDDLYTIGEKNKSNKLFRINSLSSNADFQITYKAIEYYPEIYDTDYDIPDVDYNSNDIYIKNLTTNVRVGWTGTTKQMWIDLGWEIGHYYYYGVNIYATKDGGAQYKVDAVGADKTNYSAPAQIGTYAISVYSRDLLGGNTGLPLTATLTVSDVKKTPSTPTNFTVAWKEQAHWTWDLCTDIDIDYYEIRSDQLPGNDTNLGGRTSGNFIDVTPGSRTGTAYLYAHNTAGYYSDPPATLTYDKPQPEAPDYVNFTDGAGKCTLDFTPIPSDCFEANIYLNNQIIKSKTNSYVITGAGIYDVVISFQDCFGEGLKSDFTQHIVTIYIDPAWIEEESLSLAHMDADIKEALTATQNVVTGTVFNDAINQLNQVDLEHAASVTQTSTNLTSIITELGKAPGECAYTAISQQLDGIQFRAANGEIKSLLNITPNTVTIDSKYLHITGTTQFDDSVIVGRMLAAQSITADKIATGSITIGKFDSSTQSAINGAASAASSALSTANNAQSYASNMYTNWAYPNTTYINGGSIQTNSIHANKIEAGTITASKIDIYQMFAQVQGTNGYIVIPGGVVMQWGVSVIGESMNQGLHTIPFNRVMAETFTVIGTSFNPAANPDFDAFLQLQSFNTSQAVFYFNAVTPGSSNVQGTSITWCAWGR